MAEPPPFEEAARCDVCKCSFNTFRRRHHCRCCGRTLCHEHSSNQMALPQFGIHSAVRVCYDCFNNSSGSGKVDPLSSPSVIDNATEKFSRLGVSEDVDMQAESTVAKPILDVHECKCGMPLCICEAPAVDPAPLQVQNASTSKVQSISKPKKAVRTQPTPDSVSENVDSALKSKQSLFFNLGQATHGSSDSPCTNYEANGEGLREAIKNHDVASVKKLLSEGVDANYSDKQGFSLLHLAALFNQTEITFILMDHGASVDCKNAQGETPLDCAPTTLQYKMLKKMEGV
ncbi:ankyrin repeat family protein isoform X2 [Tasmannia lanceolata]|uniref:ankyrin repeat family protein isoform X2 n=1 Tax=Tasmannia lanceolata TaxID=3420 RepID=UPI0040640882